jgi:hypothetical protein
MSRGRDHATGHQEDPTVKTTNPFRRNAAVLAAAAVVGGLGIGGLASANAHSGDTGPALRQVQPSEQSDGDGEADDATEVEGTDGAEEANDGPDQGPDANPNEPGHQDADESGETS